MLIAFVGHAGTGKTSAAMHLVQKHGFTRRRFAEPLKQMLFSFYLAAGLDDEDAIRDRIDGALKETPDPYLNGKTPRHAMQTLGTEWGRNCIDGDLWVTTLMERISAYDNVVIDDCRFDNEAVAVREAGGKIIRLLRDGYGPINGHASDALAIRTTDDDIDVRATTLEMLHRTVDGIVADMLHGEAKYA